MIALEKMTVASLVLDNIKTANVFTKFGIDFCCEGDLFIKAAAKKAKINYQKLKIELVQANKNFTKQSYNYNRFELDYLVDYIVKVHHSYILENMPLIIGEALRVVRLHSKDYPELIQIQRLFSELSIELNGHLKKEENILFPFINKLVKAKQEGNYLEKPGFDTVENPIKIMKADHEESGAIFKRIAKLSDNYTPPVDACNSFKAFYAKLKEFEKDLHMHVHLENNILFPKAQKLEQELVI